MATVYCRACKAKISYGYNACPKCGAPTSRIIPIIFAVALLSAGALLFSVYRESVAKNTEVIDNQSSSQSDDEVSSIRTGLIDTE